MPTGTILIVDDEPEMRSMLQLIVGAAGYNVVVAANGHEAGLMLNSEKVALVITDLLMPDKDGLEVLSHVRKKFPDIPVVVMSGGGRMPHGEYLRMAKTFGARAVLEKPFENERLLKMIGELLPEPKA
jgi:CheY-like chemotaxis protein